MTAGPPSLLTFTHNNTMRCQSKHSGQCWEQRTPPTIGRAWCDNRNQQWDLERKPVVSSEQEKWAASVTTNLCRTVWGKCRQDQVTSSWFSDLAVFHFTKCDHHRLFKDNFTEYLPVITVWALCWHMYHIGGPISHWLSTCGCHWSRPAPDWPDRGSPGAWTVVHTAPQQVATGLPGAPVTGRRSR